ncbi:MAG: zf-TFIIB domain-containing protein [Paracoccaceae bacterium]|nr:zf-TFIIB domain-containing protein [Paracoccaceae bacterium]
MKCPVDGENLVMTDRGGVEIDYCPACRGVWLDRGELDKIIERSAVAQQAASPASRDTRSRGSADRDWDEDDHRGERDKPQRKRRSSLLGELFDF